MSAEPATITKAGGHKRPQLTISTTTYADGDVRCRKKQACNHVADVPSAAAAVHKIPHDHLGSQLQEINDSLEAYCSSSYAPHYGQLEGFGMDNDELINMYMLSTMLGRGTPDHPRCDEVLDAECQGMICVRVYNTESRSATVRAALGAEQKNLHELREDIRTSAHNISVMMKRAMHIKSMVSDDGINPLPFTTLQKCMDLLATKAEFTEGDNTALMGKYLDVLHLATSYTYRVASLVCCAECSHMTFGESDGCECIGPECQRVHTEYSGGIRGRHTEDQLFCVGNIPAIRDPHGREMGEQWALYELVGAQAVLNHEFHIHMSTLTRYAKSVYKCKYLAEVLAATPT